MGRPKLPPTTKLVRLKIGDAVMIEDIARKLGTRRKRKPIHDAFHEKFGPSVKRIHNEVCGAKATA